MIEREKEKREVPETRLFVVPHSSIGRLRNATKSFGKELDRWQRIKENPSGGHKKRRRINERIHYYSSVGATCDMVLLAFRRNSGVEIFRFQDLTDQPRTLYTFVDKALGSMTGMTVDRTGLETLVRLTASTTPSEYSNGKTQQESLRDCLSRSELVCIMPSRYKQPV